MTVQVDKAPRVGNRVQVNDGRKYPSPRRRIDAHVRAWNAFAKMDGQRHGVGMLFGDQHVPRDVLPAKSKSDVPYQGNTALSGPSSDTPFASKITTEPTSQRAAANSPNIGRLYKQSHLVQSDAPDGPAMALFDARRSCLVAQPKPVGGIGSQYPLRPGGMDAPPLLSASNPMGRGFGEKGGGISTRLGLDRLRHGALILSIHWGSPRGWRGASHLICWSRFMSP